MTTTFDSLPRELGQVIYNSIDDKRSQSSFKQASKTCYSMSYGLDPSCCVWKMHDLMKLYHKNLSDKVTPETIKDFYKNTVATLIGSGLTYGLVGIKKTFIAGLPYYLSEEAGSYIYKRLNPTPNSTLDRTSQLLLKTAIPLSIFFTSIYYLELNNHFYPFIINQMLTMQAKESAIGMNLKNASLIHAGVLASQVVISNWFTQDYTDVLKHVIVANSLVHLPEISEYTGNILAANPTAIKFHKHIAALSGAAMGAISWGWDMGGPKKIMREAKKIMNTMTMIMDQIHGNGSIETS